MPRLGFVVLALFLLLILSGSSASLFIDYEWWKEMGQLDTWFAMAAYQYLPRLVMAVILFAVMALAFFIGSREPRSSHGVIDLRSTKLGGVRLPIFAGLALLFGFAIVNPWRIIAFLGSESTPGVWVDPVFGKSLNFYLFELPFYQQIVGVLRFTGIVAFIAYVVSSARIDFEELRQGRFKFNFSGSAKVLITVILLAQAARVFLGRYDLLTEQHGFLTGVDYVDENFRLPLILLSIAGIIASIALFWFNRWVLGLAAIIVPVVLQEFVPPIVSTLYVRANEISLERPYIDRHMAATRSAFGLDKRNREIAFAAKPEGRIDVAKNKAMLENVRLWDWQAFRDTVSQVQPLRPYVYKDADVDRYRIDGSMRQVLVAPRELEIAQLGDARRQWINPHFVYTHGYGLVMAEASRITASGLPVLFIQNAPQEIKTASLKVERPEIYFGESAHEPVFVATAQQEFDYPSGSDNIYTSYKGKAGIPMSGLFMRLAAAAAYGDRNILLTGYLTENSRMLIHRQVDERLETLASFVDWDPDPYLVLTKDGRMVWIVDGYMTSAKHPYSQMLVSGRREFNYIRNSIKATVDAYDGSTHLYVFDESDVMVKTYQRLFPKLFEPASAMPADLREHTRYPEHMFSIQAEIYRTFHVHDAENFYNKADLWDLPRVAGAGKDAPGGGEPTYIIGNLPGSTEPEFLLVTPFTPRGKDNLIGYMAARCDGANLGELVFLQLPKQQVLLGPAQVEARMDQDQVISKDLTLWNQQGSQVLRGQTVVLPIDDTFLYIKPLYLQAATARMPQLKKVLIATGNTLIYEDNYELALAALGRGNPTPVISSGSEKITLAPTEPVRADTNLPAESILNRIKRLRQELDGLEAEIRKSGAKD